MYILKYSHLFFLVLNIIFLTACQEQNKIEEKSLVVQPQPYVTTLFYTGIIQPLKTKSIVSPAEGVIVEAPFQYGEWVNKDQILFKIASSKFLNDYKAALMQYIKTKNEFDNSENQWKESLFLFKHQLISEDEYKNRQSSYYVNRLAFFQAKEIVTHFIRQLNIPAPYIEQLNIAEIEKITKVLQLRKDSENLSVISPLSGILLSATKNNEGETKKINMGDAVKEGDVLAMIGEKNAISIKIKINELTVNQLTVGQKVKVTGIAFPDITLAGHIQRIDRQGEPGLSGLPMFTAEVVVLHLTQTQQQIIHTGMSAKITIDLTASPQIMIPFSAVIEKTQHHYYVKRYNKFIHQQELAEIKTGRTTNDQVVVLAGLQRGDRIYY